MSSSSAILQSNTLLFGSSEFLLKFKQDVFAYCQSQKYNIVFTDAEIEHLSWHVRSDYQSPEAGKNIDKDFNHIPFEVKRSIARCYSFDLLLRGNEADYHEFIQAQEENISLSLSRFQALSSEAKKLNNNSQVAIRTSAILAISNRLLKMCQDNLNEDLKSVLKQNNLSETLSTDNEEFISQFAVLITIKPELSPMTQVLTKEQNALLQKVFWPNLHMRWLYSTEGGNNMTQSLVQAIDKGIFNQDKDLPVWAWRWRLNVAGFQGGPGAKFYDSVSDQLIENTLIELNKLFENKHHQFLNNYLLRNARAANLIDQEEKNANLSLPEVAFLGHLIAYLAYFHRVDIFAENNAQALVAGYITFKQEFPEQKDLADNYAIACSHDTAVTPTYVPGTMDTALGLFKHHADAMLEAKLTDKEVLLPNKIDSVSLFNVHSENIPAAISNTVHFMCQLLAEMYKTSLNQRISCMAMAKPENLKNILEAWLKDHKSVKFGFNEKMEMIADLQSGSASENLEVSSAALLAMRIRKENFVTQARGEQTEETNKISNTPNLS